MVIATSGGSLDHMYPVAIAAHTITHPKVIRDFCRTAAARASDSMSALRGGRTAAARGRWLRNVPSSWRHNHLDQHRTCAEKNESRDNRRGIMHHRALSVKLPEMCVSGLTAQTTVPPLLLLGGSILPPLLGRPPLPRQHRLGTGPQAAPWGPPCGYRSTNELIATAATTTARQTIDHQIS